jgi:hypothetical protein
VKIKDEKEKEKKKNHRHQIESWLVTRATTMMERL